MKNWFTRYMLMNEAGDLLGGGGAAGDPPAGDPPADGKEGTPPANNTPPTTGGDDWKAGLPEEIKNDPSIKSLKDVAALAKSYIHGQKLIGKDKIIVPDQHTSEEEWGKIMNRLGLPEDPAKYEFKIPEGTDAEFVKAFKEFGHKAGILPKQAEKLFGWFTDHATKATQAQESAAKEEFERTINGLKREWGQAYDRKLAAASGLYKQFADEETRAELRDLGFSNNPKVLKMMAKIAESFGEGKFVAPGGNGQMGLSPDEAQSKINQIYSQYPNHAYFNKANAAHEDARMEMAKLQAAVLAGKKK